MRAKGLKDHLGRPLEVERQRSPERRNHYRPELTRRWASNLATGLADSRAGAFFPRPDHL
jgi:hypothetical protein